MSRRKLRHYKDRRSGEMIATYDDIDEFVVIESNGFYFDTSDLTELTADEYKLEQLKS